MCVHKILPQLTTSRNVKRVLHAGELECRLKPCFVSSLQMPVQDLTDCGYDKKDASGFQSKTHESGYNAMIVTTAWLLNAGLSKNDRNNVKQRETKKRKRF